MNILVFGIGGPTPRAFVRSVLRDIRKDEKFRFIGVDCNPKAIGLYDNELFAETYLVPRAGQPGYWEAINRIVREVGIDAAIIIPETEAIEWSKNSGRLERPVRIHLPNPQLAETLYNKAKVHALLDDTGLVPRHIEVDPSRVNFADLRSRLGDGFWIRGTQGAGGLGALRIQEENRMLQWFGLNPSITRYLATEYLPGRNLACKFLYFDGELLMAASAERAGYIMPQSSPSGITGITGFGRLLNEPDALEASRHALMRITQVTGIPLNGMFTVDLKEDADGKPRLTEINIRHVSFTFAFAYAGANFALKELRRMFGLPGGETPADPIHHFNDRYVFIRDLDGLPLVMPESAMKKPLLG
jgi:carbamoyl-phosphate synthase large subunit